MIARSSFHAFARIASFEAPAYHSRGHTPHRFRRPSAVQQVSAAMRYRQGTSRRVRKRQFTLHSRRRSEAQALANIFRLEVRILGENVRLRHAACQQSQHGCDWDAQMADTRDSTHLCRINGDAREILHNVRRIFSQLADRRRKWENGVLSRAGVPRSAKGRPSRSSGQSRSRPTRRLYVRVQLASTSRGRHVSEGQLPATRRTT